MTITTLERRVGVEERVIIVQWDFHFGLGHEDATESFGTG
jgi:acetoin utilization deacetylase AcuC-like enzyme